MSEAADVTIIRLPIALRVLRKLPLPKKLGLLDSLFGRYLSKRGHARVTCANGVVWKLDLTDSCHRWIVYGKYEGGDGIAFAERQLKNGGVYIDSGANIGQWLLYLSHLPDLKTFAFEPVISQRKWLNECLAQQDQWNVQVLDFGLGAVESTADIQLDGPRSTLNMDWYQNQNHKTETVKIVRLDEVLAEHDVVTVDFWNLDVEGAEIEALKGAHDYLSQHRIKCIYFECHPMNYPELRALFSEHDYTIFKLTGACLTDDLPASLTNTSDFVAMPTD